MQKSQGRGRVVYTLLLEDAQQALRLGIGGGFQPEGVTLRSVDRCTVSQRGRLAVCSQQLTKDWCVLVRHSLRYPQRKGSLLTLQSRPVASKLTQAATGLLDLKTGEVVGGFLGSHHGQEAGVTPKKGVVLCSRRHVRRLFLGFAATRLLQAIKNPKRKKAVYELFKQPHLRLGGHVAFRPRVWLSRRGRIFRHARDYTVRVGRGQLTRRLHVRTVHKGFVWGHFAQTQELAVFKTKSAEKKKPRRQQFVPTVAVPQFHLRRLKETKAGLRRSAAYVFDQQVEAQLRSS